MERTLILMNKRGEIEKYYMSVIKRNNIDILPMYKAYKGIGWKMAALYVQKLNLPLQQIWYENWREKVREYDNAIVFNRNLNWNIIEFLKKKNPNIRVIVWYWDTLKREQEIPAKYHKMCEIWSFDPVDCIKYNFKKNVQFYVPRIANIDCEPYYDAVLIAKDKGRYKIIMEIVEKLKSAGKKVYLRIVADKTSSQKGCAAYGKALEYEELMGITARSRAIIEIVKQGQQGLTERTLEALFLRKKLITTNKAIIDEEFYNPLNIMIWDNPTFEEIHEFFSVPYNTVPDEILNKYTFDAWIENFGISVSGYE